MILNPRIGRSSTKTVHHCQCGQMRRGRGPNERGYCINCQKRCEIHKVPYNKDSECPKCAGDFPEWQKQRKAKLEDDAKRHKEVEDRAAQKRDEEIQKVNNKKFENLEKRNNRIAARKSDSDTQAAQVTADTNDLNT